MYAIGAAALGAFGFVYFGLLDTGAPAWIFFAIVISMIPHDMVYGPQAAMTRNASGAPALLGCIVGLPPGLRRGRRSGAADRGGAVGAYGSGYAVAGYIFLSAIVSLAATLFLPDYTNKDIWHTENQSRLVTPDVRFWHEANIPTLPDKNVRFWGENGHGEDSVSMSANVDLSA